MGNVGICCRAPQDSAKNRIRYFLLINIVSTTPDIQNTICDSVPNIIPLLNILSYVLDHLGLS